MKTLQNEESDFLVAGLVSQVNAAAEAALKSDFIGFLITESEQIPKFGLYGQTYFIEL